MSIFDSFLGPPNIEKLKEKGDVDSLIRAAIGYKDRDVRKKATAALEEIGDARATELLIAALKSEDWKERMFAAQALKNLGWQPESVTERVWYAIGLIDYVAAAILGPPAVEPLIAALRHKSSGVRWNAAAALGRIGDARAVEPLIAALKDEDAGVQSEVATALEKFGDARAVEPLIAVLKVKDANLRWAAAKALGKLGDAKAVEPLIAAFDMNNVDGYDIHYTTFAITEALVMIGYPAVEPLIKALEDEHAGVRSEAATVLGKLGDTRAVGPLIAVLKSEDSGERENAVKALLKIMGKDFGEDQEKWEEWWENNKEKFSNDR